MPPNPSLSRLFRPSICSSCRQSMRKGPQATFSTSAYRSAEQDRPDRLTTDQSNSSSATNPDAESKERAYKELRALAEGIDVEHTNVDRRTSSANMMANIERAQFDVPAYRPGQEPAVMALLAKARREPHHLHVYSHKHNTHIVLTRPNREPILSFSTGNIGFRKGQRGSFDAAFQLSAYVMRTIADKGLLRSARDSQFAEGTTSTRRIEAPIKELEVVLKGFGKGRDAVIKALLGTEGRLLRERIVMISDDTKVKFGGPRGMNPRRLG
ncbi:uncharacterized protein PV09_02523 [Verruconis gallopava]|uniref:Ribosomal protein S11 n=1 Tax=Verruconis gallopava TaxID=253628 RepID=A0A0D2AIV4_9PEZI|nr:uncharacterized protein PV09_02523 [Verruconis gallopava]KIW06843.1 hypothetical protein PV09_02523 [Verruconis gallopava]